MTVRATAKIGMVAFAIASAFVLAAAQGKGETFTATASVKAASGAAATAPVTIVISHTTTPDEANKLVAALKSGGAAGLRKALAGVKPTGSVAIGSGKPTPTRMTVERTTDKGRLITIVTDQPLLFLGASLPGAKPKEGFDFGVIDIEVDASGAGSGTIAPAATIKVTGNAIAVGDYGAESVRLVDVKPAK